MPLLRGEVQVGTVVLEPEPFEWPRSAFELLELRLTEQTGWATLTQAAVATLRGYYNGAAGHLITGIAGLIVQYVEGTGGASAVVAVSDWRGNVGTCAFAPNTGLDVQEVQGAAEGGSAYYVGTIRLVLL